MHKKELKFPLVRAVVDLPIISFFDRLQKFLTYRRKWEVVEDYILWIDSIQEFILIPRGFIFDGASVPKLLHSILGPTGLLLMGSCPHDFGYKYHGLIVITRDSISFKSFSKHTLDNIFMQLCKAESSATISAYIAKKTVNWFGFLHWTNKNLSTVYEDFSDLFRVWCNID